MKLTIKIEGEEKLLKKLEAFGKEGIKMIEDVTKQKAAQIERDAKREAPVDKGYLISAIKSEPIDSLNYVITSYAPYSAFQEFGTGSLAEIPEEMKEIASQFNRFQKRYSIPAQPFMYPAFKNARLTYKNDLQQGLDILTKKYNNG